MARRLALLLVCALFVATPAAADLGTRKNAVDSRIADLNSQIAAAKAKEAQLNADISAVTTQIRSLEAQVGDVSARLASLENDLALHRARLNKLTALFDLETRELANLKREYVTAVDRLNSRLVEIYESGQPSTLEIVLASTSLHDAIDRLNYAGAIAGADKQITVEVAAAKVKMRAVLARTKKVRTSVAAETKVIAYRTQQTAALRDQLVSSRSALVGEQNAKRQDVAATQASEQQWTAEANALSGVSSALAAQIQAAQGGGGSSGSGVSSSGLIWPVSGPITSPFGERWGGFHPGIDIGASMGTPIKAAASGRVIVSGYNGGYGNLVVIDHGNGLATAYAHQSSIAVSVGQQVGQGQVIGYVGSTGFSTGPHLHFEVRVNGSPVDPMGYL